MCSIYLFKINTDIYKIKVRRKDIIYLDSNLWKLIEDLLNKNVFQLNYYHSSNIIL